MRKTILALVTLTAFIAVYAAHLGLIAIGVPPNIAIALMLLVMGVMVIAIIATIDTLRNDTNSRRESAVQQSESIPSNSDQ